MIEVIQGLPGNVAAFKATGKIDPEDYDNIVNPIVDKVYKAYGKIDYLFQLETSLKNFSAMAWVKDLLLGFVYFTDFQRVAIVTRNKAVKNFTNFFGKFIPGSFRGFDSDDLEIAKQWVSGENQ